MTFLKAFLLISICGSSFYINAQWHYHHFEVMGTSASIEFWESDQQKATRLIKQSVGEMERINLLMSTYVNDSEISNLNRNGSNHPVSLSKELYDLLKRSIYFSELTSGAFDITYESVGFKYDYREGKKPTDSELDSTKNLIDYRQIRFFDATHQVLFTQPSVKINLGGIAKGHAVDSVIDLLVEAGITNAFVQAGGDSRLLGDKRGRPWTIGVRHPRQEGKIVTRLPLEHSAISTSGDYERFFIENGERVHHIIDPDSGKPANKSVSVTIIAADSTTADALSTGVFILGPEKGLRVIETMPDVSAIIIDANGQFHYSSDLTAR